MPEVGSGPECLREESFRARKRHAAPEEASDPDLPSDHRLIELSDNVGYPQATPGRRTESSEESLYGVLSVPKAVEAEVGVVEFCFRFRTGD